MNKQEFLERFKKELEILNGVDPDIHVIEIMKLQIYSFYEYTLPDNFYLENPDETFNELKDRVLSNFKTNDTNQNAFPNSIQEKFNMINSKSGSI